MEYTNWLDFQTFKRQESNCKFNEIFYGLSQFIEEANGTLLVLGLLFLLPIWVLGMISWWFLGPLTAAIHRSSVSRNAYDIEDTTNDNKITRNDDLIVGFDYEGFVVCKDGKCGIFNAKKNKMVVPCVYEKFDVDYSQVKLTRNGKRTNFNQYGERVMY